MKKILKIFLSVLGVILIGLLCFFIYFSFTFPKVSKATDMKINATQDMIKRGQYLANHVTVCMDCHSVRNWDYLTGPLTEGTLGKGGEFFDNENSGVPGSLYSKNITPANLGDWTDGEIYRLITTGVTKKGAAIFPLMPYPAYSKMDPEDVKSIIAYLRTLHPIENKVSESSLNFPLNLIVRTIPKDAEPMKKPSPSDSLAYGKYLTTIAACYDCHTMMVRGEPVKGMEYAGGFEFKDSRFGIVRSGNITPDNETGIGKLTAEQFVSKFKFYSTPENQKIPVSKGGFQSVMPWTMYAGMDTSDLRSIYKYLRTLKPVKHKVEKFSPKA